MERVQKLITEFKELESQQERFIDIYSINKLRPNYKLQSFYYDLIVNPEDVSILKECIGLYMMQIKRKDLNCFDKYMDKVGHSTLKYNKDGDLCFSGCIQSEIYDDRYWSRIEWEEYRYTEAKKELSDRIIRQKGIAKQMSSLVDRINSLLIAKIK